MGLLEKRENNGNDGEDPDEGAGQSSTVQKVKKGTKIASSHAVIDHGAVAGL